MGFSDGFFYLRFYLFFDVFDFSLTCATGSRGFGSLGFGLRPLLLAISRVGLPRPRAILIFN